MKITGTWAGVDGGWVVSRISTACEGEFRFGFTVCMCCHGKYIEGEKISHTNTKSISTENFTAKKRKENEEHQILNIRVSHLTTFVRPLSFFRVFSSAPSTSALF